MKFDWMNWRTSLVVYPINKYLYCRLYNRLLVKPALLGRSWTHTQKILQPKLASLVKKGSTTTDCTSQNKISTFLMERMYTNGCSNAINILIWKKLKLASYHLNGKALYWHQNYIRSSGGQGILWEEYVEALCATFWGSEGPIGRADGPEAD